MGQCAVELAAERHTQLPPLKRHEPQAEVSGGHFLYQPSLHPAAACRAHMLNVEKETLHAADEVHAVRPAQTSACIQDLPGCPDTCNVTLAPGGGGNTECEERERLSADLHLLQNPPRETVVEISTASEVRSIGAAPDPRRSERKQERRSFLTTFANRISERVSESIFL